MNVIFILSLLLFVSGCAVWLRQLQSSRSTRPRLGDRGYPPAVGSFLIRQQVYTPQLTASLLTLVDKGAVRVDTEHRDARFILESIDETYDKHERFLAEWFFYEVGSGGVFTPADLYRYTEDPALQGAFTERLEEWRGTLLSDMKRYGLSVDTKKTRASLILFAVLLGISGASALYAAPGITLTAWAGAVMLMLLSLQTKQLTLFGLGEQQSVEVLYQRLKREPPAQAAGSDYIWAAALDVLPDTADRPLLRDASSLRMKEEPFPLYAAVPGSAAVWLISPDQLNDLAFPLDQLTLPDSGAATATIDGIDG
ncbi:DUF2207 family protein [Alkalicoccus chagannorensis]|uniref:DUF2207 family protein n=1 Tax=Alkalicoccus chagannorensis TaxID=427072 RepID=UPI0004043609|nr:DUF2207 domain-containing protein [Alkalicoccus chagannorensis]